MTFRISLLLILITGFVLSCSTGPEFERDNMNDPESNRFIPDSPSSNNSKALIFINEQKEVIIKWPDAKYESGYIVKKKLSDFSKYIEIARLDSNTTTFTDDSKELTLSTNYQVSSFSRKGDSLNISNSPLTIPLRFDPIQKSNLSIKTNNQVQFSWEFSNRDSIGVRYFDGFLIEINKSSIHDDNWEVLDTLKRNEFENNSSISLTVPSEIFDLRLRVSQLVIPNKNEIHKIYSKTFREDYKAPSFVRGNQFNEVDFSVNWNSPFSNYDKVIIKSWYDQSADTIKKPTLNYYKFTKYGPNNSYRRFGIQLVKGDNFSKAVYMSDKIGFPVFVREPEIQRIEPVSETTIELFWERYSGNQEGIEKKFYIEKKELSESEFSVLDSVDGSQLSYTDTNLDISKSYSYRVKSVISIPSNEVDIGFRKTLSLNEISEYEFPGWKPEFSDSGILEARYDYKKKTLYIYNKNLSSYDMITFDINIPNYARASSLTEYELGKNDSLVAYVIAENYLEGRYILEIYNHKENKVINSIKGGHSTSLRSLQFTPDNSKLVYVSSQNSNVVSVIDLNNLDVKTYSIEHNFNNYYPNGMILSNDNTAILCSDNGIYSLDLVTGNETLINNISCANIFKDGDTNVIYFYSHLTKEINSFSPLTNTVSKIAQVPQELDIESLDFKYIPDLNIIVYNRARLKGDPPQFSTSAIQDINSGSFSFYTSPQIDPRRGAVPYYISYDETNEEIIFYTYNGIYNYSLITGWSKLN
ncbi:MAG: fibronectin type III domain-containing protein [Balneola sp.]|jgi:hypothetical protein